MSKKIYKITNIINNKIYIGKTTKTLAKRFKEHQNEALRWIDNKATYNSKLYPAMNKYGQDNFIIELIKELNLNEDINEAEKYYIALFNSTDNNIGYNISPGGNGGPLFKGHHHSEEMKLKQSARTKGVKQNPEFAKRRCLKHKNYYQNLNTGKIYFGLEEANKANGNKGSVSYAAKYHGKANKSFWINIGKDINKALSIDECKLKLAEYKAVYAAKQKISRKKAAATTKINYAKLTDAEKEERIKNARIKHKETISKWSDERKLAHEKKMLALKNKKFNTILKKINIEEFLYDYNVKKLKYYDIKEKYKLTGWTLDKLLRYLNCSRKK